MKIKTVDELSLDECREHLESEENIVEQRYNDLYAREKMFNPSFVRKEDFLKSNPGYNAPQKVFWGLLSIRRNRLKLDFYDVEDTEFEYKIVRATVQKMGVYKFLNNKITIKIPILYDRVMHLGDGTYLIENNNKKGLINILSNEVWLHPMESCDISFEKGIITISKDDKIIKKISTRGFKHEDKEYR